MKRIFILALVMLFHSSLLFSQNAYYDAIKLRKLLDNTGKQFAAHPDSLAKAGSILNNYLVVPLTTPNPNFESIRNAIAGSGKNYDTILISFLPNPGEGVGASLFSIRSIISNAGNLDVTNIADGFAKFLVKRTKEELNVAFFSKFYEEIKKYKDAQTLFPQTYAILSAIGDQIYNYQAFINGLRESFETDLNGLLANLPKVINNDKYKNFFAAHPSLKAICLSATYIGKGFMDKKHPGEIIADYDTSLLNSSPDVKAGVKCLQMFSESLRSTGTDQYWVDTDSLKLLTKDPATLQLYFGLLYLQAKKLDIEFSAGKFWDIMARDILPKTDSYNGFLKGFISKASIIANNIKNISGKERDKLTFSDYYDFYNSALDIVEYGTQITELPGLKGKLVIGGKFQDYIQIARAGGNIALDINRKNFGSAIINVYNVYNFAFGGNSGELQDIVNGKGPEVVITNTLIADRKKELNGATEGVKKFLLKYGSVMSAIVQAKNSDEVEQAIEAAALPSGSSRIKRETAFIVSFNAYPGLFIGHESIRKIKSKKVFNTYGVTAPLGISISRGHSIFFIGTGEGGWQNAKKGWSSSLFLSLVDIGAVAAFRFKDDETEEVPTIRLKDIFSPGAFISLGVPKSPLSINMGVQAGPNLRKIDISGSGNQLSNTTYVRYSLSFVVDIPILNFYSQSK